MKKNPKVSIIIPTYKRPTMVGRSIESCLNQTYKNIEVIVVDDNVPNSDERKETKKIIKQYLSDKRFKYIELKENFGGPIARNTGFENSSGDYINFLDDDDYFDERKIEIQLKKFEQDEKLGVVGCYCVIRDSDGNIKRYDKKNYKGNVFKQELIGNICSTPVALIKREVFEKTNGFENVVSSQEHVLFMKVFNVNPYYDLVEDNLVIVNHHSGERISNSSKRVKGTIQLYEHVQKYFNQLDEHEISNIKVHHLINICTVYALDNNRKEAYNYWKQALKVKKNVNSKIFKGLIAIILGSSYEKFVSKLSLVLDMRK